MSLNHRILRSFSPALLLGGVALLFTAGCQRPSAAVGPAAALPVGVQIVKPEAVQLTRDLPGRTSASRVAEVRARVSGIVQKRVFTEGTVVKEGELLFQIDPAPYEAALASAQANLARARANLSASETQARRYESLLSSEAISKQTYDNAMAAEQASLAEVAAAQAAIRTAQINLDYTRVTSPISGQIGRAEVTEGAYVQQGSATLLATVQSLDPLYVDMNQSAEDVLALRQAIPPGQSHANPDGSASFQLSLGQGPAYPLPGHLQFSDVSVNPSTSTVLLRGTVANPDLRLLPGLFVKATIVEGELPQALLLPHSLVSRNSKGQATTLLVNAENKVELRVIETTRSLGNRWLVTEGLQAGDRVLLDNLQKVRPGMTVAPQVAPAAQP